MKKEVIETYKLIKEYENSQRDELKTNIDSLTTLINDLINKTKSGDIRNSYTDINILLYLVLLNPLMNKFINNLK